MQPRHVCVYHGSNIPAKYAGTVRAIATSHGSLLEKSILVLGTLEREELLGRKPVDPAHVEFVRCVADALTDVAGAALIALESVTPLWVIVCPATCTAFDVWDG